MNVFDVLREKVSEISELARPVGWSRKIEIVEAKVVMEIINQVEQERNNGWIPCSSGILPEERDSIFAKWKDTDKWKSIMFEKISNEVYVTIADESGDKIVTHAHTVDGKWSCELLKIHKMYKVIAWQPLPEPYEESEYCFNEDCPFNTSNGKCIAWDGCGGCE